MDLMSKSISNHEKVVRPALIYSLFPNVSPTIYFGTRDERGKYNHMTKSRGPCRRIPTNLGEGDKVGEPSRMAVLSLHRDVGSVEDFALLSFISLSQSLISLA